MATATTSSHNPFRAPTATPTPTGASSSSSNPPSAAVNPSAVATPESTGLDEELPPAYTPGPDVNQGETTVEYGPSRPFQAAPQPQAPPQSRPVQFQPSPTAPTLHGHPPSQSQTIPSFRRQLAALTAELMGPVLNSLSPPPPQRPSTINTVSPQPTGSSSWSGYPGQQPQPQPQSQYLHPNYTPHSPTTPSPSLSHHTPQPPPLPPRRASISNPASPTSEFARDFYAAGTGDQGPPTSSSAPAGYVPPSPPRNPISPSRAEDGPPTTAPTPGRALLRDGKLLVYPKGYTCPKCHNIGFKHADPSHPCKKCWAKYAKPFSGPLAFAFSHSPSSSSSPPSSSTASSTPSPTSPMTGTTTFQRPLPVFRAQRQTGAALSPSQSQPQSRSQHFPPPPPHPPPHPPQPHITFQPPPPPPPPQIRTFSPYTPLPLSAYTDPNAVIYPAGDPRLGGRLCWNCGGRGRESFLVFEGGTCSVCAGLGRVFG